MKSTKRRSVQDLSQEGRDDRKEVQELFDKLKEKVPALKKLLNKCSNHWGYEDPVYRFYHQSLKVYHLQDVTLEIVEELKALCPSARLDGWFLRIVQEGTGKKFSGQSNKNWLGATRPIVEAFFHARYFLEMAVRYGQELRYPPGTLPSGWAALLSLYNLR